MVPANVDLLWETDTSVPPLYRGKALPSAGSAIRVMAVPTLVTENGTSLSPDDLVFTWKKNGVAYSESSGTGRYTFITKAGGPRSSIDVSVIVTNQRGDIRAEKTISIATVDPFILFYEQNPLSGTLYRTSYATTYQLPDTEATLRAEPFFFASPRGDRAALNFQWSLNGAATSPSPDSPQLITLRTGGEEAGQAALGLQVSNSDMLFQDARSTTMIIFGK